MELQMLTVKQVAEQLGLAQVTIRKWIAGQSPKMSSHKLGKSVRISIAEVQRIIAESERKSTTSTPTEYVN
jgi:excisionase family DNA binding protein